MIWRWRYIQIIDLHSKDSKNVEKQVEHYHEVNLQIIRSHIGNGDMTREYISVT